MVEPNVAICVSLTGNQTILFSGSLALSQGIALQPILTFYLTLVNTTDTSASAGGGNASIMYAVLVQGDKAQLRSNLISVSLPIYINCMQNGSSTQARDLREPPPPID